jgi:hypothetical protein
MNRRRAIRLNPSERATLEGLYLGRKIATDRYQHRPLDLSDLTNAFNGLTGRDDSPQEVLHYMRTNRKAGTWPTLNGSHRRLPTLLGELIADDLIPRLIEVYVSIGVAVDNFGHDLELATELERRFVEATGIRKPGILLATVLMELRKDSRLPKIGQHPDDGGFRDLDAAEGM